MTISMSKVVMMNIHAIRGHKRVFKAKEIRYLLLLVEAPSIITIIITSSSNLSRAVVLALM